MIKAHEEDNIPMHGFVTSSPGKNYLKYCLRDRDSAYGRLVLDAVVGVTAPTGIDCPISGPTVLISEGIGAAPMKSFLETAPDKVQFVMHVDESEHSHPFRKEFRRSRVDSFWHYTAKDGLPAPEALLERLRPHLACKFFLCGPNVFVNPLKHALTIAGATHIHCIALDKQGKHLASSQYEVKSKIEDIQNT
jgi:hypothetical protein